MNFAVDLMMMKSMNKDGKNDKKVLSTIYDINGENLFCLSDEAAIKYYETVNFLKENNKEPSLENVKKVIDVFLKEYDPFYKLLSPKKYTQSYIEHIQKIKKKKLMQVLMESAGFVYMGYQIYNSMKKLNTTSKLKYIPLIVIVLYVSINLFNAYYANYTKKEYNIVKGIRSRLSDISGNVYVQISEIHKINSKASSLFYEMLKSKTEIIIKYIDNKDNKDNKNNVILDSDEIGIELSKLEEIERQIVPSAFINKSNLFMEDDASANVFSIPNNGDRIKHSAVPELFPQENVVIEIDDKSVTSVTSVKSVQSVNQENIIELTKVEDDKLSVTEEILEEIKNEIQLEEEQQKEKSIEEKEIITQKEEQVNQVEQEEIIEEKPKRKGRQPAKQTKTTKSKQTENTKKSKTTKAKQNKKK